MNWRYLFNRITWLLLPLGIMIGGWQAWQLGEFDPLWQGLLCGFSVMLLMQMLINWVTIVPEYTYRVIGVGNRDVAKCVLPPGVRFVLRPFERVIGDLDSLPKGQFCQVSGVATHARLTHEMDCHLDYHMQPYTLSQAELKPIAFLLLTQRESTIARHVDGAVREIAGGKETKDLQAVQSDAVLKEAMRNALQKRLVPLGVVVDGLDFGAVFPGSEVRKVQEDVHNRIEKGRADNQLIHEHDQAQDCLSESSRDLHNDLTRMDRMGENGLDFPPADYYYPPPQRPRPNGRPKAPRGQP